MSESNLFTVLMSILTMGITVVSVWAFTRKNKSTVETAKGLSEVNLTNAEAKAREAEVKERADLIEMIKESGKNSVIWLETLKVTEHKRELDYATLKAIIEDGTQETINSRTKLLSGVDSIASQAREHNTGVTNSLDELKRELNSVKTLLEGLPDANSEIKKRLDILLGYIERLLPKLRPTSEMPIVSLSNGASVEVTTPPTS